MFLINSILSAQEHSDSAEMNDHHDVSVKNKALLTFGYAWVEEGSNDENNNEAEGVFVPTIGFDYFRKINHKWEIGIMTDLELAEYIIIKNDIERERAFLVAGVVIYEATEFLLLQAGAGFEYESHESFAVLRTGIEFPFEIGEKWMLAPSLHYDIKKEFNTVSISVAFGMEF